MGLCAIIGDSIALGLAMANPGCDVSAKVGRPANIIANRTFSDAYEYAIISAGANNPRDPNLARQLQTIRDKTHARQVVWIVPLNSKRAASIVKEIAKTNGDEYQEFTVSNDGVHPKSYKNLWALVKTKLFMYRTYDFGVIEAIKNNIGVDIANWLFSSPVE